MADLESSKGDVSSTDLVTKKANDIMDKMFSSVKMPYVRFFGWALRKIWRNIYDKVG